MEGKVPLIVILIELCFLPASDPHEYIVVEKELSWAEAVNYCRSNHIDLASIENSEENAKVLNVGRDYFNGFLWIGLHYSSSTRKWSMGDEYETNFRPWAPTEPNDFTQITENCVATRFGQWNDFPCGRKLCFFCFTGSSPSFKFINTPMEWYTALEYCRKFHVDLAVVRNPTENIQLMTLGDNNAHWIGLHTEVIWKWSNGKRLSYTNWKVGEPNQGLMGRCVYLRKGHWEDDTCERPHYFICSAEVPVHQNVVRVKVPPQLFRANLHEAAEDILLQWNQRVQELYPGQDIKLRWRTQPDGKIFYPEKKKEKRNIDSCVV